MTPDTRAPRLAERIKRECQLMNQIDQEDDIMARLEAVSVLDEPDRSPVAEAPGGRSEP
jgi:hypothetical protein